MKQKYNKTSLNRQIMGLTLNIPIQGGGQFWELEYGYNGIVWAIIGTQIKWSMQGSEHSVEVVGQRGFTVQ